MGCAQGRADPAARADGPAQRSNSRPAAAAGLTNELKGENRRPAGRAQDERTRERTASRAVRVAGGTYDGAAARSTPRRPRVVRSVRPTGGGNAYRSALRAPVVKGGREGRAFTNMGPRTWSALCVMRCRASTPVRPHFSGRATFTVPHRRPRSSARRRKRGCDGHGCVDAADRRPPRSPSHPDKRGRAMGTMTAWPRPPPPRQRPHPTRTRT